MTETIYKYLLTANLSVYIGQQGELYFNKIHILHDTVVGLVI